jgi:PBP1b-binding outer membrane lipoprotein LpoB
MHQHGQTLLLGAAFGAALLLAACGEQSGDQQGWLEPTQEQTIAAVEPTDVSQ